MAITIITDPISISINENVSGRNHIDLGSLVLTDQRWAGLTFTLTSATDDDGNDVVGFSLILVDGIYKIRYQRQVGLDAEETSTVRLNIAASDGTEIAPIVVQVNDLNDTPPFLGEYITASDSVFIFESNKIPSDRINKNYFQSSVDLFANRSVRAGAEGTGEITITLLRDDGVITITGEILGMSATGSQNYFVWAVRNGNDWSVIAQNNTGDTAPTGYEESQFLYVLNYASGYAAVQKAADGTRILKKYPTAIVLNVKEDAEVGSLIFKLPDVHTDTGAEVVNVIFIEGYGTDSEYFTFDAQTREIRLAKAIDYEAEEHYSIVFQITATSGGRTQFLQQWVIANVVNVDDNGPIFADLASQGLNADSDNNGTLAIPIQITDTATIFTAMASDADGDDIVYSITSGNTSGMFEIDANTGVVSLAQGRNLTVPLIFDYELTITATSTSPIYGSVLKSATQIVKLEVVSTNLLQFSTSNVSIKEANFGATPYDLADVTVTAGSQFRFITSDDRFEVVNGKLRIKANSVFDFESLQYPIINVSVHAQKEGYHTISENFRLTVEDANDLPPIFKHDVESTAENFIYKSSTRYNGSIHHYYEADLDLYASENIARAFAGTNPIGITLYTDQGPVRLSGNIENFNNPTEKYAYVIWAVRKGEDWSLTASHRYYTVPTEGVEEALYLHTYAITRAGYKVMTGSAAVPTGETAFVGTPTVLNINTDENQAVDTVIYTVPSAIPDVSTATVTYTLLESGHYQYFTLDAVTRELKVKTIIDAETITELTIIVRATAVEGTGDSQRTTIADQIINIDVNYVDEYLPVFSNANPGQQNRHALDVNENHDENVVIYTAQATDLDAGETVTYRITSQTHDGLFVIDPTTGEVKLAAGTIIDAEQHQSSIEVVITAFSGEPERASDPLYLDINLINLNDNSPHMSIAGTQVQLEEGTYYRDAGTGYTVSAIDADGGDVVYTISDNRFFVDADGMLMVKSGAVLDFESEPNIRITFTAMDTGVGGSVPAGQDSSVTEEITIHLTDFDESLPPPTNITFEAQSGTLIEGVSRVNPSFIVSFSAINSQNFEFSVDDDRFYIVGNHLILKAGETFDYETETSVVLTISGSKPTSPVVTGTFTLNIIDANDLKPEFESTVDVAYAEGLSVETVVHTVTEAIPDTAAAVVTYELLSTGDHSYFDFDQQTRVLKIKNKLDHEVKPVFTVTIRATATHGEGASQEVQTADQIIQVIVTDVNDTAPRISRAKILYDVNFGKLSTLTRHNLNFTDPDLNEQEPEEYTYTLLSTARGVTFYKKGVELAANSTFTHLDLLNGLITYKITNINFLTGVTFSVSEPQNTSLNITTMIFEMWVTPLQQSNNNPGEGGVTSINLATVNENHLIRTGNGIDYITASRGSDEIHAGKGDDIITLDGDLTDAHTGGEDTVIYNFIGSDIFVAADGGDKIIGFRRGEDVLVFNAITDDPRLQNKEGFFNYLSGKNKADSIDDFLIISPLYELSAGSTNLENLKVIGIFFHFQGASTYGTGNIAEGSVSITFDQALSWAEFSNLIAITDDNGVRSSNFDFGRGIISDISILPSLLGAGSFVFRSEGPEFGPLTIPELVVSVRSSAFAVRGTEATELLLANTHSNEIHTNGGDDLVIMGSGNDHVYLSSGTETIFYRFESSNDPNGKSVGVDAFDTIHNFEFGKDKIVLVDTNQIDPFDTIGDFGIFTSQMTVVLMKSGGNINGIELIFNDESATEKAKPFLRKSLYIQFTQSTHITADEQAKWDGLNQDGRSFENPGFLSEMFGDTLDVVGIDLLPPELVFV